MKKTKLMLGDNIESLKKLPENSVDSIVTDPPYGLSFMGKKWDHDVPSVDFWKEVYRVLKPGGHVLSFGGTRTYHRMVVNIEDAGFEIRDQIMWLYGSGFPKSHNIGKAVDKLQGNDRKVVGEKQTQIFNNETLKEQGSMMGSPDNRIIGNINITKGQSDWEGWGTALKPANEPICVARKPLSEKSVAENVLKWGTGGINIDGCRVGSDGGTKKVDINKDSDTMFEGGRHNSGKVEELNEGRFPANIILECLCDEVIKGEKGEVKKTTRGKSFGEIAYGELNKDKSVEGIDNYNDKGDIHTNPMCPCYIMDEQSGVSSSQNGKSKTKINNKDANWFRNSGGDIEERWGFGDKGGASRFFYQAKVSKAERNMGLDGFEDKKKIHLSKKSRMKEQGTELDEPATGFERFTTIVKNNHPTVKPVNLMAYLCRLVTPPNGIVLDPYMGSGATGIAAQLEGFRFVGMELDEDYFKIAEARINNYEKYSKFKK